MPYVYNTTGNNVVEREIIFNDVVYPIGNFPLMTEAELAEIGVQWVDPPPPLDPMIPVTDSVVRAECKRRILDVASEATQSNLNAYMNVLSFKASLTAEEQADVNLFVQSMDWINAMRARVLELIGDPDYNKDEKWPPLTDELRAFAARF